MERIPDIGKDSRTSIKRAKLDFNLFFNNYQDLAVLSNLMMSDSSKILAIKEKYPTLKEQEYRVLLLIIQNYTSKEMAMLLSCTEKNIEYYRTQIRLKLEVPKDHGLKEFIQLEFQ
jgi:DNA-binding CsgD family transcriptional regulator